MEWKALPQRKRFKVSDDPSSTHQPDPIPVPLVEARDKVNTDDRLEALDGVAGEFFEYLDHTADVQCHAWGATLNEAFQNTALCMVNYMTDLSRIEVDPEEGVSFECAGHDLESLLFKFLDEILYRFCTDSFCPKTLSVKVDTETYAAQVDMQGCIFDPEKHGQGTEIKAITYSNMQIHNADTRVDLYVIVDI